MLRAGKLDATRRRAGARDHRAQRQRRRPRSIEDILDVSRIITGKLRLEVSAVDLRSRR